MAPENFPKIYCIGVRFLKKILITFPCFFRGIKISEKSFKMLEFQSKIS